MTNNEFEKIANDISDSIIYALKYGASQSAPSYAFESPEDAFKALMYVRNRINDFGKCTVSDFHAYLGWIHQEEFDSIGWQEYEPDICIKKGNVYRGKVLWVITLSEPEPLNQK